MVGIIICTHSNFAAGLKNACEMISGPQPQIKAVCFSGDEQITELGERLKETAAEFSDGCVFAVDLANATPFNASLYAIAHTDSVVVSGVSLPMLLELTFACPDFTGTPKQLVQNALESKEDYITLTCSQDIFKD